ncbi:ATP-sensitive inward rectifier potassium channel 12-like [Physella acuta]|uniref:ATP-sensitive inward rectifier potassium channel 12-like n=1 Tax=Physella acuta TaxID=109671 RepID=UPI0027DB30C2|nr:ATP-sensitive inward rectifier potassium channel 12-like [Physella acuta]
MNALCAKRRSRAADRSNKRRLMHSTGHNIVSVGIEDKYKKFLSDLYTTLIDIQWRWNILIFVSGFVVCWVVFAGLYYLLCYLHGDMEEEQEPSFTPCLENVRTFTAAYLFSIETMMTIGYGSRFQTEECPGMYMAVMLQSIIGAGLQFALASIVVSKTRRAKRRSQTILFSDRVCIYEQDSKLQLSIRICDIRESEISGAHAEGFLVKKFKSNDGTFIPVRSFRVSFKAESGRDEIFFPWPTHILHVVDEDSPLWSLARDELLNGEYELIVVVDGVSGTTSRPFQARKSYHTSEMMWGHRFVTLGLTFNSAGSYVMDLTHFHNTLPACTPLCSAQDITTFRKLYPKTTSLSTDKLSESGDSQTLSGATSSPSMADEVVATPSKKRSLPGRSLSLEEDPSKRSLYLSNRRCSLGDMIRASQGTDRARHKRHSLGDALNIYRHRRSITDTYLGTGIDEESEDDYDSNQAILTVVSQRSAGKRTDVRDLFKRRKSSGTHLFFGTESELSENSSAADEAKA